MIKIGMISLGCAKNRVDSELMLGALEREAAITPDPAEADIIIVNTCGFIESAKQESINTILEMAEYKKTGSLKGLIVTGCLSERYRSELISELPEVDAFLGMYAHKDIARAVSEVMNEKKLISFPGFTSEPNYTQRMLSTPFYQAYVRISEGCDNRCSYCAIPYIRGNLRSRRMEDIEKEVAALVKRGVSEVILVAQDTTVYGRDIYGSPRIVELIERLAGIQGVTWLRLLYAYPEGVTEELLKCMTRHENVVKYIDIPIQHFSDAVLKRMNRRNTHASTYEAVKRIRKASPDFIVRTTLIAGFPGETEEDFEILKKGVEELRFDRLGVFAYSQEEGTPAGEMPGQIDENIKNARADEIMRLQAPISEQLNAAHTGRVLKAIAEERLSSGYAARTYMDAPDIDGTLFIRTEESLVIGEYYDVKITDSDGYDLIGELI